MADLNRPEKETSSRRTYLTILAVALVAGLSFYTMFSKTLIPSTSAYTLPQGPEFEELVQQATAWIQEERDLHLPEARALTEREKTRLAPFFPAEILDSARIRFVPRFKNPDFLAALAEPGEAPPLDLRTANAMALDDTILALEHLVEPQGEPWLALLFHELVHVVQYKTLGTPAFIRSYIQSLEDANFDYFKIRHEAQAYELQHRFEARPGEGFSVVDEVEGKFPS